MGGNFLNVVLGRTSRTLYVVSVDLNFVETDAYGRSRSVPFDAAPARATYEADIQLTFSSVGMGNIIRPHVSWSVRAVKHYLAQRLLAVGGRASS